MGKNAWKIDMNRGHDVQLYDAYGNKLPYKYSKITMLAECDQKAFGERGQQGAFETVAFQLMNALGVAGADTAPVFLRIVENTSEVGSTSNQYDDDFQGLYLLVEDYGSEFLEAHNLPDGNLYKMESGSGAGGGSLVNQGPTQVSDNSDLLTFVNTYSGAAQTESWWRANFDLDSYYSYRALVECLHHWDISGGMNYMYYHNPETGKWSVLPWDLDLTFTASERYNPSNGDNEPFKSRVLAIPAFQMEYKNRLREVRDLLWNNEQVIQMLDAYAALINTPIDGQTIAEADRRMWDWNPIVYDPARTTTNWNAGPGLYYARANISYPYPNTFAGVIEKIKAWALNRIPYIDTSVLTPAEEQAAPITPTVTFTGGSGGYKLNNLTFGASSFAGGTAGGFFVGMQWRIADVTTPGEDYEIDPSWTSEVLTTYASSVTIPATAVTAGNKYRVRVRYKDSNGRWSHWSAASAALGTEFVALAAESTVQDSLRITEINYNPKLPDTNPNNYKSEDFEFVEVTNTGLTDLELGGVKFIDGITFTFPAMTLRSGESTVVVKNAAAFAWRYPTLNMKIAGIYADSTDKLDNGGETLTLVDALGQPVQSFRYDDEAGWPTAPDGGGYTLTINSASADPALATSWHASLYENGTPGATESAMAAGSIVVNEILAHTDASVTGDWVEFYNTTDHDINISGWFLSDSSDAPQKYQVQPGTIIPAHGYIVFDQFTQFDLAGGPGVVTPFSFSELGGEKAVLASANVYGVPDGFKASQNVDATNREAILGRTILSDGSAVFTQLLSATKGLPNAAPYIAPVVISELLYNPVTPAVEYVELTNRSSDPVPLYDPANPSHVWKFSGITFVFPAGTVLNPGERILVVPTTSSVFLAAHPEVPGGTRVFGPFTGSLDNAGEKIELLMPGDPEPDNSYAYYTEDWVKYGIASPWPVVTGTPIAKTDLSGLSADPINWGKEFASTGSPGKSNFNTLPASANTSWTINLSGTNATISSGGSTIWIGPSTLMNSTTPISFPTNAASLSLTTDASNNTISLNATTLTLNGKPLTIPNLTALTLNVPEGGNTLTVANKTATISLTGVFGLQLSGSANVTLGADEHLASLSLADASRLNALSHTMVVDYTDASPIQGIRQWIYNGATGAPAAGITTTAPALASIDNAKLHKTQWKGQPLSGTFCQVIITPALAGDANLDGVITPEDELSVYANLGKTNAHWLNGDVNNDGTVTLADLALVQSNQAKTLNASLTIVSKPATQTTQPSAKAKVTQAKAPKHKVVKKIKKSAK